MKQNRLLINLKQARPIRARIYSLAGVRADHQCSCKSVARLMDTAGSKWCLANAWMLAGMIGVNAKRRGVFFPRPAGWIAVVVASLVALAKKKPPQA